jgi:type II secretory ATPase GspE/PulE/Tfp pilus assembly ATPase PilB-like protein
MAVIRPTTIVSRDAFASEDVPAPVSRVVDDILRRALADGASDVHIEPLNDGSGYVRYRVDGVLRAGMTLDAPLYAPLISRIKLLASMDIANRRLPQDGRYTIAVERRRINARISSLPTFDGEKLVIRLLDYQTALPQLDDLGIDPASLRAYRVAAHAPWGFVVVSGPTGSGKTTTLYATIGDLDRRDRNICTVEDPVEGYLRGCDQWLQQQLPDRCKPQNRLHRSRTRWRNDRARRAFRGDLLRNDRAASLSQRYSGVRPVLQA